MSKLKKLLPGIFQKNSTASVAHSENRLETDALPVNADNDAQLCSSGSNNNSSSISFELETPTASADLTASVVRELTAANYDSANLSQSLQNGGTTLAVPASSTVEQQSHINNNNTMNVHNAQQQIVMNFENASNVHFGTVFNYNNGISATNSRKSSCGADTLPVELQAAVAAVSAGKSTVDNKPVKVLKTRSIVEMMQSKEMLTHRMRDTIATHLGQGWRDVMRDLNLSNGEIEQAVIDHHNHGLQKEVIYQLLLKWERSADDGEASLGRITNVLWKLNQREIVERMKLVWKSEKAKK